MRYRGRATPGLEVTLAWAYSGALQYEIVVQHDDGPSVFRDVVEQRGYGFHHFGRFTTNFDAEVEQLTKLGHEKAFEAQAGEVLDFARVVYLDTRDTIGAMLEIAEYRDLIANLYRQIQAASVNWDGKDPIRHIGVGPQANT